ncbi:hypothetical protein ACWD5R_41800 [Streptomyces sp. NPDC002514]|uniref:hypothetical protein n=1 Tax=Streptomyces sp. NPDC001270 TaxID=3364554 RepID=UPI0036CA04C0
MRNPVRCTAIMLSVGVLLAGGITTAAAAPSATAPTGHPARQSATPVLVDCSFNSDVRPGDFILACGDGNSRLTALRWSHWGQNSATAEGVNLVNDCKPYCAAGTFREYPVTVRLDHPKQWQKNPELNHYTRIVLTFSDSRPTGQERVTTMSLWN